MQETLSCSALVKTYRLNLKLHFIVFLRILKTKKNIISKTYLYLQKFNLRRTKSFPNKNFVVCLMYLNVSSVNCQTNTIDYQETRTDTLTDGSAILSRSYLQSCLTVVLLNVVTQLQIFRTVVKHHSLRNMTIQERGVHRIFYYAHPQFNVVFFTHKVLIWL